MASLYSKKTLLISGACVYKETSNGYRWLLTKAEKESDWEITKAAVRKVESSVRAIIRVLGEQGGMNIRVLEEAGRAGGITTVNGKSVPQRHIYYLAKLRVQTGEVIGFAEAGWFDYAAAVRKLGSKRERQMLKEARFQHQKWLKEKKARRKLRK